MRKYVVKSVLFLREGHDPALIARYTEKALDRYTKHFRDLGKKRDIGVAESILPF